MNNTEIIFYNVKDIKIKERTFDGFICYDIYIDGATISLYTKNNEGIPFFRKINQVISSLRAYPDDIQGDVETLEELFPIEVHNADNI